MRRIQEYTLVTVDGVFERPTTWGFAKYRDDAYLRDGLGVLHACDAMLMGRTSYEQQLRIWPERTDPWATRINAMKKYVVSSTLERTEWNNVTLVRGDAMKEIAALKQQDGGDLLIFGHTKLARSLLAHQLIDAIDLSVHPVVAGHGQTLFQEGAKGEFRLAATKTFSHIVKLTLVPLYPPTAA